ncbi:MAG: hypothetical protein HZB29_09590 [Nitrospinae bacterium]|nr:hypothetical protein [Nitrospinota bacterium]
MDGVSAMPGNFNAAFSFKRSISALWAYSQGDNGKISKDLGSDAAIVNIQGGAAQSGDTEIKDSKDTDLELLKKTFGIKDAGDDLSAKFAQGGQESGGGAEKTVNTGKDAGESGDAPPPSTGGAIQFQAQVSVEVSGSFSISTVQQTQQSDPLALDLTGEGIRTTGVEGGAQFDINADGVMDRTSYATGGTAFLAMDKNGDGTINNGSELFGDQNGAANGFEELARYDQNGDGWIDPKDQVYSSLRLAAGGGADRFSVANMKTLEQAGVAAIGLRYAQTAASATSSGDSIAQTGTFIRSDGSQGMAGDLMLNKVSLTA